MADLFTQEELEELRRFDAEIDAEDEAPTYEEIVKSREKDRAIRAERRGWKLSPEAAENRRESQRAYYQTHKAEAKAYREAYREKNREEINEKQRAYNHAHRAERSAWERAWRAAHPEEARARARAAYQRRKEKKQHEKHDGN